jgi:hypothetical protein
MQTIEGARGKNDYMAGLVFAVDSLEKFTSELREAKAALLAWQAKRQGGCKMVMFTITSPAELIETIERQLEQLRNEEVEIGPFLKTLQMQVAFLNNKGNPVKQYSVTPQGGKISGAPAKTGCLVVVALVALGVTAATALAFWH